MPSKPQPERLYQIDVGYACFGVILGPAGRIVDAAPIGRWMIGKGKEVVARWVNSKRGSIEFVPRYLAIGSHANHIAETDPLWFMDKTDKEGRE